MFIVVHVRNLLLIELKTYRQHARNGPWSLMVHMKLVWNVVHLKNDTIFFVCLLDSYHERASCILVRLLDHCNSRFMRNFRWCRAEKYTCYDVIAQKLRTDQAFSCSKNRTVNGLKQSSRVLGKRLLNKTRNVRSYWEESMRSTKVLTKNDSFDIYFLSCPLDCTWETRLWCQLQCEVCAWIVNENGNHALPRYVRILIMFETETENRASSFCSSVPACVRTDNATYVHFQRETFSAQCRGS